MVGFVAKLLYKDEGASVMFDQSLTFLELNEKIRFKFPVLEKISYRLKFSVPPEITVYQLEDDSDIFLVGKVLEECRTDYVVINIYPTLICSTSDPEPSSSNPNPDACGLLVANEYLGCYRREEPKLYMSKGWKSYIKCQGQTFEGGVKEFRTKLRMYAIEVGFEFVYETNKPDRVIAVCKKKISEGCSWHVKASLCRYNGHFEVYALHNEHGCRSVVRLSRSNMVSSDFVKDVILDKVRDNPNSKAVDIQKDLKLNFGLEVPYHKAWYGKELARAAVLGDEAESYSQLNWFAKKTWEANPDSRIAVDCLTEGDGLAKVVRFKRMFVSYGALLKGFQSCRSVINIDATFITNKYRGMIMAACTKDANCGLYPIAYGIVDSETESNWTYFLTELLSCLSKFPPRKITFICDRNLGLMKAIQTVFPDSYVGFCYRHLRANLTCKYPASSKYSKLMPALFMSCAYSRTRDQFEVNFQKFKDLGGPVVATFLKDLPLETWTACYFNGERLGEMTNNLAESFNSWIKDLKSLPIVEFNEALRVKIMSLISARKMESAGWVTVLCPNLEKMLADNLEIGRHWLINRSDTHLYEAQCQDNHVVVDLQRLTCSCGEWQVHGFPCPHSLAAIQYHGGDIYEFVNSVYQVAKYVDTYSYSINGVSTISKPIDMDKDLLVMLPPLTKRPAGRPKVNRYKSRSEVKRILKCGRCKSYAGHNRKTCKAVI